eukprot:TRINITY_DN84659_c0_g1_i1.p1 TRINITY_DN84659_c0_g1~~TRINITY_DN84659_c0_g1_i1.p1  ORF type:complete len:150 (+),score=12.05 TRINITY_DN84659_c0_g1_i1:52-501(+)
MAWRAAAGTLSFCLLSSAPSEASRAVSLSKREDVTNASWHSMESGGTGFTESLAAHRDSSNATAGAQGGKSICCCMATQRCFSGNGEDFQKVQFLHPGDMQQYCCKPRYFFKGKVPHCDKDGWIRSGKYVTPVVELSRLYDAERCDALQ